MSNLLVSSCGCYLSTGEEPSTVTDEMVEDLFVEVNQFTLVCMSVCVCSVCTHVRVCMRVCGASTVAESIVLLFTFL